MSRRKAIWLGAVAVAITAGAACAWLYATGSGSVRGVPVYEVRQGEFSRAVHAEGNLEAREATVLGPPADIEEPLKIAWLAIDGTPVHAGDPVVRFDPSDLEKALTEGRHDGATADSRITRQTVSETSAQHNLARDAELADQELEHSKRFQSKDPLIFSRSQIIESEVDQALAAQRRDHARRTMETRRGIADAELGLLEVEKRKAQLKIDRAERGLRALDLRAPHDGIFVLKKMWGREPQVGQMVWGEQAVAEIPQVETMQAKVYVLEADAGGLREGLTASVVLEAHPETTFDATVSGVDALAQPRNYRSPVQYFGLTLEFARVDPELMKPGQRVTAVISVEQRADAVTVPRQAVFDREGKKVVYRSDGAGFEPVEVTLGPTALGLAVVEHGLEAGDRIALRDPTRPEEEFGEPGKTEAGGPAAGAGSAGS